MDRATCRAEAEADEVVALFARFLGRNRSDKISISLSVRSLAALHVVCKWRRRTSGRVYVLEQSGQVLTIPRSACQIKAGTWDVETHGFPCAWQDNPHDRIAFHT